jgi:hypothetical protein
MIYLGFISRNEFADIIKLILHGENGGEDVNDAYIEELTSAMDFDKNGKIDFNEFLGRSLLIGVCKIFSFFFLESFRIVNVKPPQPSTKSSDTKDKPSASNGTVTEHKVRV